MTSKQVCIYICGFGVLCGVAEYLPTKLGLARSILIYLILFAVLSFGYVVVYKYRRKKKLEDKENAQPKH